MSRSSPSSAQAAQSHGPCIDTYLPPIVLSDDAQVPLGLIDGAPFNPRTDLEDIEALAASIQRFGLLQPVLLRRLGPRYECVAGHRRVAAYQLLKERHPADPRWQSIAAVTRRTDADQAFQMLVSAQLHSINWTPVEEAAALERLIVAGRRSLQAVAELLGRDVSWVSKRRRVNVDPVLAGYVQSGTLAPTTAEELLPIGDLDQRSALAERAAAGSWSQSETRRAVRSVQTAHQPDTGPLDDLARQVRQLMRVLRRTRSEDISNDIWSDLDALRQRIAELCPRGKAAA